MTTAGAQSDLLLAWRATLAAKPGAVAVSEGLRSWTRAEIEAEANSVCASLPPLLDLPRRKVAMAELNGARWLVVFLALLRRGAVPVLLDPADSPAHLAESAEHLGVGYLWNQGTWSSIASRRSTPARQGGLVKVTSGSSGRVRGFFFTDAQILADGRNVCEGMGIRPEDRNLAAIPFGHSYGLGNLVVPLLAQGTACVCAESPLPACLSAICRRHAPTVFPAVPILLKTLARSLEPTAAFSSLRLVISAGAPIRQEDACAFRKRFGLAVHVFYGSSETGGISFDASGSLAESGEGVGTPLPRVHVCQKTGGRIEIRSEAVVGRGIHRPADTVRIRPDGTLVLTGRVGRMVKLGGRRLDLSGLETEIQRLPGVRGVIVEPHPQREDSLAALIATDLPQADMRALLRASLSSWKIPARLRVVPEFPLTGRGKVDRAQAGRLLSE